MKCSKCGSENAANTKFCTNCGTKISTKVNTEEVVVENNNEGSGIGWGFLGFFIPIVGIILFFVWKNDKPKSSKGAGIGALIGIIWNILVLVFIFSVLGLSFNAILNNPEVTKEIKETTKEVTKDNKKKVYTIDEDFTFDNLKLNISSTYEIITITDEYSSYKGTKLIKMPISIKNVGEESNKLNSYYLKIYGPDGTEQEQNYSYEYDDGLGMAGDLRQDASYTKYLYFEYKGTGEYVIEFDNYDDKLEVKFKINE